MIRRAFARFAAQTGADSLRAVEKCTQHPGKMWVVRGDRMPVGLDRATRENGVLADEDPHQQDADADRHRRRPEQGPLQRLRPLVGEKPEIEERLEEVAGQQPDRTRSIVAHDQSS